MGAEKGSAFLLKVGNGAAPPAFATVAALHPAVEGAQTDTPPVSPVEGQSWIVGLAPTGGWTGQANRLALWTEGGWRFVTPQPGTAAWDKAADVPLTWDGVTWSGGELRCAGLVVGGHQVVGERAEGVPSPSGGTIIDAEARAAINGLIAALMSHGLID